MRTSVTKRSLIREIKDINATCFISSARRLHEESRKLYHAARTPYVFPVCLRTMRPLNHRTMLRLPIVRLAIWLLALTFCSACLTNAKRSMTTTPSPDVWPISGTWAETELNRLTLEQKVSQLIAVPAFGKYKSADDPAYKDLVDLIASMEAGGVIFFQGDPLTQAWLTNDLQKRAALPLLVSQDLEWGLGMRLQYATTFPRTMALGATRNPDFAYASGYVTAQEARALGTHHIFAPVADINNNPYNPIINVRSFGEDPAFVADMVAAYVQGVQDAGGIATVKHFPGHGDTATDSHADMPTIDHDRDRLDALELVPFRRAIDEGVMSVMTGHLYFPEVEPEVGLPGTLSPRVTNDLLREELGFQGLIVTDAMNMHGVTKHFGVGEAAVRVLEAGADMVLMPPDPRAARNAILNAVAEGRLSEERLDASVRRVLRAKEWVGLHDERMVDLDAIPETVTSERHQALTATMARHSLTLLRNADDLLPLSPRPQRLLTLTLSDTSEPNAGLDFLASLRQVAPQMTVTHRLLDERSTATDYASALAIAEGHDVILLPTFLSVRNFTNQIRLSEAHQTFIHQLTDTGKPVVLVSFGNPYLIMGLPDIDAYVAAYSHSPASQHAVAESLLGQNGFQGKLPIRIPDHYAVGDGLTVPQQRMRIGQPEDVGMDRAALDRIDSLLTAAITDRAFPGAAVAIGRGNTVVKLRGYGYHTYTSDIRVTPESIFDLASITKVVATTTAVMQLVDAGRLHLDRPVAQYLPAFGQNGKENVTVRQLLTHTAGLRPFRRFYEEGILTRQGVIDEIMSEPLIYKPGTEMRYSDFSMITVALIVEQITRQPLDAYAREYIFEPLGMFNTSFRPTGRPDPSVVPTEDDRYFRNRLIQGEVHDEAAWILGGTAGHAGLFSTATDLVKFAYIMTQKGQVGGYTFIRPETVETFTMPVDPTKETSTRALGWDTKSPENSSAGDYFSLRSFGHTGFTGNSFWIDPETNLFVILLTNRVYPTRDNRKHIPVRQELANIAYEAVIGPPEPLLPTRR